MQFEYFHYFIKVVQCQSINQASKMLNFKQSHLSKIMSNLEDFFQTTLFIRNNQGISLTKQGELVYDWVLKLIHSQEDLQQQLKDFESHHCLDLAGELTIFAPANITSDYFKIIHAFTQQYPNISITIEERGIMDILQQVLICKASIGITLILDNIHRPYFTDQHLFYQLAPFRIAAYTSKDSDFARKHKTTSLKALCKEPLIIYKPTASSSPVEDVLSQVGKCHIRSRVCNLKVFYALLQQGDAITIGIARQDDPLAKLENLVPIPIRDKFPCSSGLVISNTSVDNPLVMAFIQFYLHQKGMALATHSPYPPIL